MTTAAIRNNTYKTTQKRETFIDRYLREYKEYLPSIICGVLSMNGSDVYPVYKALTK